MKKTSNPDQGHDLLLKKIQPKLAYSNREKEYFSWKKDVAEKFEDLIGLNIIKENICPLNTQVEWIEKKDAYTLIRFTFDSEENVTVPCYLLIPNTKKEKYPVAITLHGHSTGFHLAIGQVKEEGDEKKLPRTAFALQAVERGYIALAIEQRGMGERRSPRSYGLENKYFPRPHMCAFASLTAISLGRTIIGERVWDVSRAIDALADFPECDLDKIVITGNSGGGTASYYAACVDERIKLCVPSCSFSPYDTSILDIEHCVCNYIPNIRLWMEMQDLSCLIAPRNLVIVAGEKDDIFPIEGVRQGFQVVKSIYKEEGKEDNCSLVETPMGHWWCEDIVWDAINKEIHKDIV